MKTIEIVKGRNPSMYGSESFMFAHHSETGYTGSLPGIIQKTLVWGENTLMTEFRLQKDTVLPRHSHTHEQTGYLVSGHMTLQIGNDKADIRPGDSWNIPGSLEHGATIHEDSVAIEIFYPVRKEYLP
jgi:quercetin dioxygenase-like cupin family protein